MDVKSISFGQGIQRSPSLSMQSGELSECVNLVPRGGELVNVHPPKSLDFNLDGTLMYVHEVQNDGAMERHYIYKRDSGIYWKKTTEKTLCANISSGDISITSLGRYLILTTADSIRCFLWETKTTSYRDLGQMPDAEMEFSLVGSGQSVSIDQGNIIKQSSRSYALFFRNRTDIIINKSYNGIEFSSVESIPDITANSKVTIAVTRGYPCKVTIYDYANPSKNFSLGSYDFYEGFVRTDITWPDISSWSRPSTKVEFMTSDRPTTFSVYAYTQRNEDNVSVFNNDEGGTNFEAVMGTTQMMRDRANELHKFMDPFYARYGLRLYDGSIVHLSAPILMVPHWGDTYLVTGNASPYKLYLTRTLADLKYKIPSTIIENLSKWSDIIKGVVIGVTDQIPQYNDGAEYSEILQTIKIYGDNEPLCGSVDTFSITDDKLTFAENANYEASTYFRRHIMLPRYSDSQYKKMLSTASVFNIIAEKSISELKEEETLDLTDINLSITETYPAITNDESGSRNLIVPKLAFPYNGRLNIANLSVRVPAGLNMLSSVLSTGYAIDGINVSTHSRTYKVRVDFTYESASGSCTSKEFSGYPCVGLWRFASIEGAKKLTIYEHIADRSNSKDYYAKYIYDLTESGLIEGSYGIGSGCSYGISNSGEYSSILPDQPSQVIPLPNEMYTSKLYNPFFFPSANTSTVGSGTIHAISTSAKALSSGTQFGAFPLYCFCSDGIWPLTPAADGTFDAPNPLSRDVLPEGCDICQIDAAIIFPTNAGLKFVEGQNSTGISQVMNGYNISEGEFFNNMPSSQAFNFANLVVEETDDFATIIKSSRMLYDYANGLLHIYPKTPVGNTAGYYKHYAFSLAEKAWTTIVSQDSNVKAVVPGYPYSYIQTASGDVMRFTDEADLDIARYGTLLTREIPFGDPFALKVLADLRHLKSGKNSEVSVKVFVSNDRTNWYSLPSLRSRAFKWFRFRVCTKLKDLDTLTALQCLVETRRSSKLR